MANDYKSVNALSRAYDIGYDDGFQQGRAEAVDLLKGIVLDLDRCNHYDMYNELMYQSVKVDDVIEVIEQIKEQKNEQRKRYTRN